MNHKTKTALILLSLAFLNTSLFSQNFKKIDALANEMCQSVIEFQKNNPEAKDVEEYKPLFLQMGEKHVGPYLSVNPTNSVDSILTVIELRLQKVCKEYALLSYQLSANKADWVMHTSKPSSNITEAECKHFYSIENYVYLEPSGDKVQLEIKDGFWIDHFIDGTYSKLKISKLENCEFEIEFIESNNESRKALSEKGDKYQYTLLESKEGYYEIVVEIPDRAIFNSFKLYYEK